MRKSYNYAELEILFNILITKFDIWKSYYYMVNWDGYKPDDIWDTYRIIGELWGSLKKGIIHENSTISTAGFEIGIVEDCLYVLFDEDVNIEIKNIDDLKKAQVFEYVPITRTIRILKLYDGVVKKDF